LNIKKKFKFSLLVSAIFALLVGLPFYGVSFYNSIEAKKDVERELKNGQAYATKYAQIQVELYISKISAFIDNLSVNTKVIESFEKNNDIEEILSEVYDSEAGVDIDFLFAHKLSDNKTINISSSIYNTDLILSNLNKPLLKLNKNIEITFSKEDGNTIVYAFAIRPIISRDTGEVLGDITAGIVLNNNLNMLESLKEIENLVDIDVFYKNEKILDLAQNPTATTARANAKDITIKGDKVIAPFKLTISGAEDLTVFSTYTSNSFSILEKKFEEENFVLFFLILGLAVAFFILFNFLITSPLKKLVEYTRTPLEDITISSPEFGIIDEFQKLGTEFHKAFARLAILNQGLEKEVKERTVELEEKKDLLEKQLIELKSLQDRMIAQEKLTSLGLLLAGVSHEIRNPLNLIQNSALILDEIVNEIEEEEDDQKRFELFEEHKSVFKDVSNIVIQHSQRSTRIIKSMLDQSRGSSVERTQADIKDVILTNLNYINKATDTAFYLKTEITKSFAKIDPFYIYERELGQVIVNIFENSFYALMKKSELGLDGFTPKLVISTTEDSGYAVIKIRDNGIGIPAEILADIFKAFKTTKPAGEGTGLGLSVSKDIIRKHDGDIQVDSEEGEFTEFTIRLPIRNTN
jgi:signal transduction histidine kinase